MITPEVAAKAFVLSVEEKGAKAALDGLASTLTARGALSLLPRVVAVLERMQTQASSRAIHITVAKKADASVAKEAAERVFGESGAVSVDDTLIGGYRITKGGEQLDASYKSALIKLYHSFIS